MSLPGGVATWCRGCGAVHHTDEQWDGCWRRRTGRFVHDPERVPVGGTVVGPVVAFREWWLDVNEFGWPLLLSFMKTPWLPGVPTRARCMYQCASYWDNDPDAYRYLRSPHVHGSCGLYGLKSDDIVKLDEATPHLGQVWGEVYLWGEIVEHDLGYRAQFGYPKTLFCHEEKVQEKLRRVYLGGQVEVP